MAIISYKKTTWADPKKIKKIGFVLNPSDNKSKDSALLTSDGWKNLESRIAAQKQAERDQLNSAKARAKTSGAQKLLSYAMDKKFVKASFLEMPDGARLSTTGEFYDMVKHYANQVPGDRGAQFLKRATENNFKRRSSKWVNVGQAKEWFKAAKSMTPKSAVLDLMATDGLAQIARPYDSDIMIRLASREIKDQVTFDQQVAKLGLTSDSFEHRFARAYLAKLASEEPAEAAHDQALFQPKAQSDEQHAMKIQDEVVELIGQAIPDEAEFQSSDWDGQTLSLWFGPFEDLALEGWVDKIKSLALPVGSNVQVENHGGEDWVRIDVPGLTAAKTSKLASEEPNGRQEAQEKHPRDMTDEELADWADTNVSGLMPEDYGKMSREEITEYWEELHGKEGKQAQADRGWYEEEGGAWVRVIGDCELVIICEPQMNSEEGTEWDHCLCYVNMGGQMMDYPFAQPDSLEEAKAKCEAKAQEMGCSHEASRKKAYWEKVPDSDDSWAFDNLLVMSNGDGTYHWQVFTHDMNSVHAEGDATSLLDAKNEAAVADTSLWASKEPKDMKEAFNQFFVASVEKTGETLTAKVSTKDGKLLWSVKDLVDEKKAGEQAEKRRHGFVEFAMSECLPFEKSGKYWVAGAKTGRAVIQGGKLEVFGPDAHAGSAPISISKVASLCEGMKQASVILATSPSIQAHPDPSPKDSMPNKEPSSVAVNSDNPDGVGKTGKTAQAKVWEELSDQFQRFYDGRYVGTVTKNPLMWYLWGPSSTDKFLDNGSPIGASTQKLQEGSAMDIEDGMTACDEAFEEEIGREASTREEFASIATKPDGLMHDSKDKISKQAAVAKLMTDFHVIKASEHAPLGTVYSFNEGSQTHNMLGGISSHHGAIRLEASTLCEEIVDGRVAAVKNPDEIKKIASQLVYGGWDKVAQEDKRRS